MSALVSDFHYIFEYIWYLFIQRNVKNDDSKEGTKHEVFRQQNAFFISLGMTGSLLSLSRIQRPKQYAQMMASTMMK